MMSESLSLSFYAAAQEQVQSWNFHTNLEECKLPDVLTLKLYLKNPSIVLLEKSFEILVRRHESLRTSFDIIDGALVQVIYPYDFKLFSICHYDFKDELNQDILISQQLLEFRGELRKLSNIPLFRAGIFRVAEDAYYTYITIHHIISDMWSLSVIKKELNEIYDSLLKGNIPRSDPHPVQLRHYTEWQRGEFQNKLRIIKSYWSKKLDVPMSGFIKSCSGLFCNHCSDGLGATSGFGCESKILTALDNSKISSCKFVLDKEMHTAITDLSFYCKSSISSIFSAALKLLFFLLEGNDRVLVAMPIINRFLPGSELIVGDLVGGAYLYDQINKTETVKTIVREVYFEILEVADLIISDHDELELDGKYLRLNTDVFLNFIGRDIIGESQLPASDRDAINISETDVTGYYKIVFNVEEYKNGYICDFNYNIELVSTKYITRFAERYMSLLRAMCKGPDILVTKMIF
ncbi:MAG: hypothetical protein KF862_03905 [Chitinophagaceae bacterium]|nr:hypothetical protein [Chitinophagaceae bacterium]